MGVAQKMPFEVPYEGNESTRAARQVLNQAIDDLEAKIMSLKREKNQLASTSVLPPEILFKIFMLVRDSPIDFYFEHRRNHSTHWISSVGHICHHWREVALNCPALWSIPIFTNPELVQEMMRRSKMVPLTIQLTAGSLTSGVLNEVENVMTQMFRIRDLHLSCSERLKRLRNVFAAFSQPAPHLEQLALTNMRHPCHLLDNAFVDAPHLRSIELNGFDFCWTSAIFKHSVTNLKVKGGHALDTSSFSQLLEALGHMPNLQNLSLADCIPSHMTANKDEPTLHLSALRTLEIASNVADCIQFLRCIKYPPHTIIALACTLAKVTDCAEIFAHIGENLRTPSADHSYRIFKFAKLELDRHSSLTISLHQETDTIGCYIFGCPLVPDVSLRFRRNQFLGCPSDNILRDLFRFVDLESLEAIEVDWFSSDRYIESIRETMGKLPKLEYFCTGVYGAYICQAMRHPISATERGQGRNGGRKHPLTVFPALKKLYLHTLDLNEFRSPGTLHIIENILTHRSKMNAPIQELQMDDCRGVRVAQKRMLGGLVDNLFVDGDYVNVRELDSGDDEDEEDDEECDEM